MDENLNNSACENFGTAAATVNSANSTSSATSASASSARVKRMRGWLGVKSSTPSYGHGDDGGPVSYGDAPNGWNRQNSLKKHK